MKFYLKPLFKCIDFSGRTGRKEYWLFVSINAALLSILVMVESQIIMAMEGEYGYGMFSLPYAIFISIPIISATVRRLHDVGLNGWWLALPGLCLATLKSGDPGQNRYGISPNDDNIDHLI